MKCTLDLRSCTRKIHYYFKTHKQYLNLHGMEKFQLQPAQNNREGRNRWQRSEHRTKDSRGRHQSVTRSTKTKRRWGRVVGGRSGSRRRVRVKLAIGFGNFGGSVCGGDCQYQTFISFMGCLNFCLGQISYSEKWANPIFKVKITSYPVI